MHRLLDVIYLFVLLLLSPWLLLRAWRTGRYRQNLRDKLFGFHGDAPEGAVWFHGVSVGEIQVLRQFVGAFRKRHPEIPVVVSTTTDSGLTEARKHFADLCVVPFPFDFSWAVERTLDAIQPSLVVLCESELWPNFVHAVKGRQIPLAVVNGRMSPRSLSRYRMLAPLVRWMFRALDVAAVQTEEYAAALLSLGGVPGQVVITGNIKYDGANLDRGSARIKELRTLYHISDSDLIWIVGSTQAPEEEVALGIYQRLREQYPSLRLILVPRSTDRFDEVAGLVEKSGLSFVRRSKLDSPLQQPVSVVVVDTIGELGSLWGLADIAYVGGSLDGKRGGQNMIEPAAFGVPVTFGPHVWNFKDTAGRLINVGAAYQIQNPGELEAVTARLLRTPDERRATGALARAFVLMQQGATERTLDLLEPFLRKPTLEKAA